MQRLVVLSVCLIMSCLASPVVQRVEAGKQEADSELATTAFAFDLAYPASVPIFKCFAQMQYTVAFIRAYDGSYQGQIDPYAISSIQNAAAGETAPNFSDFTEFGSWISPSVKQFGQSETVCGITVNRDVYSTSSDVPSGLARHKKSDRIVVGRLGLQREAITGKPEIIPK
ncbi:hypothetical protein GCK32_006652 [Trichostrongylus colubriformis]|uniref:Uncharacterized protein n=1 Tax=Trichostrongylus colubriformis TaxID=6319 RepID=A0AAN8FSD5_TRICO